MNIRIFVKHPWAKIEGDTSVRGGSYVVARGEGGVIRHHDCATPGTRMTCLHPPHATSGAPGGGCSLIWHDGHAMMGGMPASPTPASTPTPELACGCAFPRRSPPGIAMTWWHPAHGQRRTGRLLQHRGAERAFDHPREGLGPRRLRGGSVPTGDDRGDGLPAGAARHRRHAGRDEQLGRALGARRDEIAAVILRVRVGHAGAAVLREVRLTHPA